MSSSLLDLRLLFVTGKGGVGRSTIAASLATLAASMGQRTLACELDSRGDMAELFECRASTFTPNLVEPNLWSMTMDTEAALAEYLRLQLRLPVVGRFGPLARMLDFVATAAPGVREILTVGKIAWEVREAHYDLVVVDAVASGHILSQLGAPAAINRLIQSGLVRQQTGWVADLLADSATTGVVVVTTAEEMPVSETIALVDQVKTQTDASVAAVVVNRVLPELFSRSEEALFERLVSPDGVSRLAEVLEQTGTAEVGKAAAAVLDCARLAVRLRRNRVGHLDRLAAVLDPSLPLLYVPELFTRGRGRQTLTPMVAALGQELLT